MDIFALCILAVSINTAYSFDYNQCDNYECNFMNKNGEIIDVEAVCKSGVCIAKCCRDGYIMRSGNCTSRTIVQEEIKNRTGKHVELDYKELRFYDDSAEAKEDNIIFVYNKVFEYGRECTYEVGNDQLFKNGTLHTEFVGVINQTHENLHFCVEYKYNDQINSAELVFQKLYNSVVPNPNKPDQQMDIRIFFNAMYLLVSVFFLLLVVLVHILLGMYKKLADMMMLAYVTTLTTSFLIMSAIFFQQFYDIGMETCQIVFPFYYVIWLATFFWLTVMSFDMWWTVRNNRAIQRVKKTSRNKKFLLYCLYAYGTALAIGGIALSIESSDLHIVKPSFDTCMVPLYENLYYKQIPISILTIINCILFVMTFINIWTIKRELDQCKNSRQHIKNQSRFKMYLKLSFLMGVNWLIEVGLIVIEIETNLPLWLKLVLDSYNAFVGFLIFIIFICNDVTLIKLADRFNIQNDYVERIRMKKPGIGVSSFTVTSRDA